MQDLTEIVSNIKSELDLRTFSSTLGIDIDQNGKSLCPFHSEKTPSMVIYPSRFKCFGGSCGKYGDFIDLFLGLHPGSTFIEAVSAGSEFVGSGSVQSDRFSNDEVRQAINRSKERRSVDSIYEDACKFYEDQIFLVPEIIEFARLKWGFAEEIIKKNRIGFAPSKIGLLSSCLQHKNHVEADMLKTGLFYKGDYGISEVFRDRIIFPYLIGGTPKYFIARVPRPTEEDNEFHKKDRPKYQKLAVHNPEKRPYISTAVSNNHLFGEDSLFDRRASEIIITEGVTDAILAKHLGFPVVSPVTTRLKSQDLERYLKNFQSKSCVYIANDNEQNQSGIKGAFAVASYLESHGCYVRIVDIPKPEDVTKIDLNDFLKRSDNPVSDFTDLLKVASTPLLKILLDLDPNMDEIERTRQILSYEEWWLRVSPADVSTYIKRIKEHFKLTALQGKELLSEIKSLQKEGLKKSRENSDKKNIDRSNFTIKDVVDEYLYSERDIRLPNKIADEIFIHLEKSGAQFYSNITEGNSILYHNKRLYSYGSEQFKNLIYELVEISKESSLGRQVFDCLNRKIQIHGHKIDMFSWIYTTKDKVKYINLSGDEGSRIIVLDPKTDKPFTVPNGNNKDSVILTNPINAEEFIYQEESSVKEGIDLYKKLVFDNMSCETENRYMITCWLLTSLFNDQLGTRPHMRFDGTAGSGKTTAAKMLTALMFGKPKHQNASTMAAIYESSRADPIVCLDNIENKDLTDQVMNFIIASATRASRQKKGGASFNEIVEQSPQCMVMTTGIEPLYKNELIQRTLVVGFDAKLRGPGFLEQQTLDEIRRNRDVILSSFIKIAFEIYKTTSDYDAYSALSKLLTEQYIDNPKERNIDALCHMYLAAKHLAQYIQSPYVYSKDTSFGGSNTYTVGFIGNETPEDHIYESWIDTQAKEHENVSVHTNEIVYFLESLYSKWKYGNQEPGFFESEYGIEASLQGEAFILLATIGSIHRAFAKLSKEGIKYTYDRPMQLSKRITDSGSVLQSAGWIVGRDAKKTRTERIAVFAKINGQTEANYIKECFPSANW